MVEISSVARFSCGRYARHVEVWSNRRRLIRLSRSLPSCLVNVDRHPGILLELAHITVQMLLAHAVESSVAQYGRANRAIRPPEVALGGANPT